MHRQSRTAIPTAAIAATLLALAVALPGQALAAPKTKAIPQTSCFWPDRVATAFAGDAPEENYAFPDAGAIYWTSRIQIPLGAEVILKGKFAHARYTSLNSYTRGDNTPTDALNDVGTIPNRGSRNPFLPGARRDTPNRKRRYTVSILNEQAPAERAPNTLYAGVPGQAQQQIIYRVYLPEPFLERELTGSVGLHKALLRLSDGTILRGQAACDALQVDPGQLDVITVPEPGYKVLRGTSPTGAAENPVEWSAFYNIPHHLQCEFGDACNTNPERTGGQFSNIDNAYASAYGSRAFSEGPVLVLRGKLPSTPQTGRRVKRMPTGDLRYWSLCQNESLVTTVGSGCLYDAKVRTNRRGRYTIVSSLLGDRPANARAKCGVGFIPWPERGSGAGHPDDSFLILRNMLPAPGFDHAVQRTSTPGDEAEVMGPYLPKGTYTTTAAFEKRGC